MQKYKSLVLLIDLVPININVVNSLTLNTFWADFANRHPELVADLHLVVDVCVYYLCMWY